MCSTRRTIVLVVAALGIAALHAMPAPQPATLIGRPVALPKLRLAIGFLSDFKPRQLAFSPDGTRLVIGSCGPTALLCDAVGGELLAGLDQGHVEQIDFAPDSRTFVASGGDGVPQLWDARTGRRLAWLEGCPDGATTHSFSPD